MSDGPERWSGHAPDLVRDNRLMHERVAKQDRKIEDLEKRLDFAVAGLGVVERRRDELKAENERLQAKYAAQCNRWAHCRAALDQIREHKHHGDCSATCAVHLIDVADMAVIADDTDDGGPTAAPESHDD